MYISDTEITSGIAVGEAGVVEAEEVKDGGMKVVHMSAAFDGLESEFVGGTVEVTTLDAGPGHPDGETVITTPSNPAR